jgi:hypothetical protein
MTLPIRDPETALRALGCQTCASRIQQIGSLPVCLFYPSGYFGSSLLPRMGCEHWRCRDVPFATSPDVACVQDQRGEAG